MFVSSPETSNMKFIKLLLLIAITVAISNCTRTAQAQAPKSANAERDYYQLLVYSFNSDQQVSATDQYLQAAFLPGLKRMGIENIGVFKRRPTATDTLLQTFVLIPFKSMDQFLSVEDKLNSDAAYLSAGSSYINTPYDQPAYARIESTLMRAFSDFPVMRPSPLQSPRVDRIYELRSYESASETLYKNKVDMFNAGGEVKLFDRLDFNSVFYGEVISGSKMPNLMYLTTFADQASRDEHWKAFGESPEWQALIKLTQYKNNVSKNTQLFLYPTAYSDY